MINFNRTDEAQPRAPAIVTLWLFESFTTSRNNKIQFVRSFGRFFIPLLFVFDLHWWKSQSGVKDFFYFALENLFSLLILVYPAVSRFQNSGIYVEFYIYYFHEKCLRMIPKCYSLLLYTSLLPFWCNSDQSKFENLSFIQPWQITAKTRILELLELQSTWLEVLEKAEQGSAESQSTDWGCGKRLSREVLNRTLNQCFAIQRFPAQPLPTPSISALRFSTSLLSLFPHPQSVLCDSALPCSAFSNTSSQVLCSSNNSKILVFAVICHGWIKLRFSNFDWSELHQNGKREVYRRSE